MKYIVPFIVLFGLSACYEDTDVTIHEPGVYKGKPDSHVESYEAREDILAKRFQQVQTDR
ncbi:hypothetical protein [Methylophaga sp.]|jgi:hypothetical protein|uniref:hypothetical protein n=1 Tax=Methylophaga sp. TaxID=2024840 RepID=UPI0013FF7B54|nr:hypothetical protein [Methylophaga sp.]MTI63267.1 hypothetical protein [Methylophaga sp.]